MERDRERETEKERETERGREREQNPECMHHLSVWIFLDLKPLCFPIYKPT